MKKQTTKTFLAVLLGAGMSHGILQAQNPFYEPGDLVLFFQKPGATKSIYVGLGSAANLYRGSAAGPTADRQAIDIINIDTQLEAAFGAGWASDPNVYAGLIAARSNSPGVQVIDGDQTRTLYASRSRSGVGSPGAASSAPWDFTLSGANTTGSTSAIGFTNIFETNYTTQAVDALVSVSKVDNYNPFLDVSLGIQSTAFQAFPGGVQQRGSAGTFGAFGPVASPEFLLDLYRIVPRDDDETVGEVSGVKRIGSYEGTITVDSAGSVSFITQGATSAYTTWIDGFNPPLTNPADREADADPDKDGIDNLMEFVLNGNPTVSGQAILPTLDASGANFVFEFTRRADSADEVTQVFEYSTDLVDWTTKTPIAIPTAPGSSGFVTVGATTGTPPNEVQAVSISIPKGVDTKLFGRLKAEK